MAHEPATSRARNGQRTITLPITEEQYAEIIDDPQRFREEWLNPFFADCPELFPPDFAKGYEMNGRYRIAMCLPYRKVFRIDKHFTYRKYLSCR